GIRVSELAGLRPESVNFEQGWIMVYGKGGKERIVPVNSKACEKLKKYLSARAEKFAGKETDSEMFVNRAGKKISRVQIWKDMAKLGVLARIERKLHPHLFRHTFASHMLLGGADLRSLQEMLGHANLNTTQIYTALEKKDIKDRHSKYHPRG
ncbi:MAG: tyrosine-type recombinase/integrase, partial [Elusimicrobia bacterium]|nr:tyrosine-type recombinase/integrase [Elusimicrobiota bacterium]